MEKTNLLKNPNIEEGADEGEHPFGWTFIATSVHVDAEGVKGWWDKTPTLSDPTGRYASLVIEHTKEVEVKGSRWEQQVEGIPILSCLGKLLRLSALAKAEGDCLQMGGARLLLEAISPQGNVLASAEDRIFKPTNIQGGGEFVWPLKLKLIMPDGAQSIKVAGELSGKGKAWFGHFELFAQDVNAQQLNDELVDILKSGGAIRSPEVEHAFRRVLRHHFLPDKNWGEVYSDRAILTRFHPQYGWPISSSSQPSAMSIMLEQLKVKPGMKVLEIGTGTGYNVALLAELTGNPELVFSLDLDKEICDEAQQHLKSAGYEYEKGEKVHVICADGWHGCPEAALYDCIIVTAYAYDIAPAWFEQLKEGGILVMPWGVQMAQRTPAFRKERDKLIIDSISFCGFMTMRGEFERLKMHKDASGRLWESDWLTPKDLEQLKDMSSEKPWEKPFLLLKEHPPSDYHNFLFFIGVEEPRMVRTLIHLREGLMEGMIGLVDLEKKSACFLSEGESSKIIGWGNERLSDELESLIRRWLDLGQPSHDRLQLVAYPLGTAPAIRNKERLVRKRWFEYVVAWT